jgi:hypothetical protein
VFVIGNFLKLLEKKYFCDSSGKAFHTTLPGLTGGLNLRKAFSFTASDLMHKNTQTKTFV